MNLKLHTRSLFPLICLFCITAPGTPLDVPEVRECGCASSSLCLPLGEAVVLHPEEPHVKTFLQKKEQPEVFAFVLPCNSTEWLKYDWNALTTVSVVGWEDQTFLCHAHNHGVRVVPLAAGGYPADQLTNATARTEFVTSELEYLLEHGMDGINMDFETPLKWGSPEVDGYTALVKEMSDTVHGAIKDSQISVDLGLWVVYNFRHYDSVGLAEASDLIFVMAYDSQNQNCHGRLCTAGANAPFVKSRYGIHTYLNMGIPANKLVLGLPWYGYHYICEEFHEDGRCRFREPGTQIIYKTMMEMIADSGVEKMWDELSKSPYASIQSEDGSWIQMWYDDYLSLQYKTDMAAQEGLKGTGIWTSNFLDYGDSPEAEEIRSLMWDSLVASETN